MFYMHYYFNTFSSFRIAIITLHVHRHFAFLLRKVHCHSRERTNFQFVPMCIRDCLLMHKNVDCSFLLSSIFFSLFQSNESDAIAFDEPFFLCLSRSAQLEFNSKQTTTKYSPINHIMFFFGIHSRICDVAWKHQHYHRHQQQQEKPETIFRYSINFSC